MYNTTFLTGSSFSKSDFSLHGKGVAHRLLNLLEGMLRNSANKVSGAPEIRSDELKFLQQLGSGSFGSVFLGECRGETVAIKKLHATNFSQLQLSEFKKEVAIFTCVH